MNKKIIGIIIAFIVALALVGVGYFYLKQWQEKQAQKEESRIETVEDIEMPSIKPPEVKPVESPLKEVPDVNPAKKTNPFESTYKNPFE
jgi:predicted RND superfamily exporter protein